MPTVSEFWDGCAQNYDAQVGTHYAEAYEKTAACFKKYLKPTDTVLDFACGTGIVTFAVAPSVQSVRAIDVSGEMVRRAQEKAGRQGAENVTVTQTDLSDASLAEGSEQTPPERQAQNFFEKSFENLLTSGRERGIIDKLSTREPRRNR